MHHIVSMVQCDHGRRTACRGRRRLVFFHPGGPKVSRGSAPRRHPILWGRYSNSGRLVLVLDPQRVLAHVGDKIKLSPINAGAARMVSHLRGPRTTSQIGDWLTDMKIADRLSP